MYMSVYEVLKMNFKYEFGSENQELYRKMINWENGERGGYVLCGQTGVGKTTFIKELVKHIPNVKIFQGEAVVEKMINKLKEEQIPRLCVDENVECIIVDHFSNIADKEYTIQGVSELIHAEENCSKNKKRLIICSFTDEKLAERFSKLMNYELIHIKHVKPNASIVENKVEEYQLKVVPEDAYKVETMLELHKFLMKCKGLQKNEQGE